MSVRLVRDRPSLALVTSFRIRNPLPRDSSISRNLLPGGSSQFSRPLFIGSTDMTPISSLAFNGVGVRHSSTTHNVKAEPLQHLSLPFPDDLRKFTAYSLTPRRFLMVSPVGANLNKHTWKLEPRSVDDSPPTAIFAHRFEYLFINAPSTRAPWKTALGVQKQLRIQISCLGRPPPTCM